MSLWLSADRVPPGSVDVAGVLVNHTGVAVTFGVAAEVERWDGDDWVPRGWLVMCLDHWHCTAELERSVHRVVVPAIGLAPTLDSPGPVERFSTSGLEPGWYRISQTGGDGVVATGVLEIAEGAAPPAPLVPVERPAVSIHPPVLPTGGGPVRLHPIIPAPSGSQSISDVESAIAGLSESADIERWDGERWVPVSGVPLEPAAAPAGSSVGRSAVIPALDPGAYRLVRTGSAPPHIGHFWVRP